MCYCSGSLIVYFQLWKGTIIDNICNSRNLSPKSSAVVPRWPRAGITNSLNYGTNCSCISHVQIHVDGGWRNWRKSSIILRESKGRGVSCYIQSICNSGIIKWQSVLTLPTLRNFSFLLICSALPYVFKCLLCIYFTWE